MRTLPSRAPLWHCALPPPPCALYRAERSHPLPRAPVMNASRSSLQPSPVAFFDLDRTLIDVNSGRLFAQYEFEKGRISARQLARALLWSLGYHLSLIDLPAAYAQALAHYRGVPEADIIARTAAWFDRDIVHRLLPQAREAMAWHRAQEIGRAHV